MAWGRNREPQQEQRPALAHHRDGRPLLEPGEAAQVDAVAAAALATVNSQRFDIAKWNEENRAEVARRAEVTAAVRRRALPYTAGVAVAATGAGGWGAAALAELLAGPAGHLIASAATPAAAAVALAAVRLTHRQRIADWSGTFRTASVGAVGWLAAAATVGPGWWPVLLAALAGGASLVAQPWMRAHRVGLPAAPSRPAIEQAGPTLELPPPPPGMTRCDEFAARWHRDIARNGKLDLTGCELTDGHETGAGKVLEFTLQLVGGRTLGKVREKQEGIASALGLDPMQLTFDHTPPLANGFRDTSRIAVQIILSSPITKPVYFTGPRFTFTEKRYGLIDLGPCVDGQRVGNLELFRPQGMFSTVVIGSTGAGKSSVVNGIVVSARSSGMVATIYFDPKGNSSPDLARHATVSEGSLERFELFTQCIEDLAVWLGKQAKADNRSGFDPRERTAYLIIIDECDIPLAIKGMGDRWGRIAKTLRALGGGLLLITQIGGLKALGMSDLLRSSIRAGNVILMRTESNSSDALIAPDLPRSTTLPRAPGYIYLGNTQEIPGAIRSAWLLTSDEEVPPGFPDELKGWNADVALTQYPDAPLCPIARRCLAPLLDEGDREERQKARTDLLRAEIAAFLRGDMTATERPDLAVAASSLSGVEGLAARFAALPGPMADVIPIQRRPMRDERLNDTDRAVLDAVQDGLTRTSQIVMRTQLPAPRVSNSGKKLAGFGYLVDGGYGVWTLPKADAS